MSGPIGSRLASLIAAGLMVLVGTTGCGGSGGGQGDELEPVDAYDAVIEATARYPLVALGEYHLLEQWHDFMGEMLLRPELVDNVDDFVIEFGNGLYQDVADRFLLDLEPVGFEELSQIWRNTIGGGVLWDAPVYEQFFRNVRSVNEGLPLDQRFRVLLGDPDIDYSRVRSAADTEELDKEFERDAYFAEVVEREVVAEGRRAILISGSDHFRREVHANVGEDVPNAVTLIDRANPGELYVIYPLPWLDRDGRDISERIEREMSAGEPSAVATVDGTWLGDEEVSFRAMQPERRFAAQVDAVIWFGPRDSMIASRPDPAIYEDGEYADELRRRSAIYSEYFGEPVDFVAQGMRLATASSDLDAGR